MIARIREISNPADICPSTNTRQRERPLAQIHQKGATLPSAQGEECVLEYMWQSAACSQLLYDYYGLLTLKEVSTSTAISLRLKEMG